MFDLQRHLEAMEARIREDVKGVREAIHSTDVRVSEAQIVAEEHAGRIKALEEKAGWIGAGFGAGILAIIGFVWHIITKGH